MKADPVQAAKWHLLAREAGVSDFSLDIVLSKLTKEERAKAEKAAEDWREEALERIAAPPLTAARPRVLKARHSTKFPFKAFHEDQRQRDQTRQRHRA